MSDIWTVPAKVLAVVDGDTLKLHLSLGWHLYLDVRVRLIGCNAPEVSTEEGVAAKAWVIARMAEWTGMPGGVGADVTFVSHELDKYGRPLGQVLISTAQGASYDLSSELMTAGHALPMKF